MRWNYNMKRYLSVVFALVLALTLTACAASASGGAPEAGSAPEGSASLPAADGAQSDASLPEADVEHQLSQGDNIVPHEQMLYCGNTVTKIYPESLYTGEDWEASFWGGDSVALTDLLLYLDYREGICRCLPEYMVETEFSEEPYGVNLTEGYARHGDSQVDLTQEQVELIRDILDRNLPGPQTD